MQTRAWLAWGGTAVAAAGLLWWLSVAREYRQETSYNNVRLVVASPREVYQFNEPIPIRLIATNTGPTTFVYDTLVDGPLLEPHTPCGLGPPRPANHLLFLGHTEVRSGQRSKFAWVWSEHARVSPRGTRLELKLGES